MKRAAKAQPFFEYIKGGGLWLRPGKVCFSARIAGMKKQNGSDNVRCVRSGILL